MRTSRRFLLIALAAVLAVPASAAASPPGATTGDASSIGETGATLNGTVNPNKEETTYWFEYGTTPAYGAQTAQATAGGGNAGKAVSTGVTGLSPATTYHFRLVVQNPSGTDLGQDRTFTTLSPGAGTPPPPAVSLASASALITFGSSVVLSGQATGQGAPGAEITLQQSPFPFTAPFAPAMSAVTADGAGAFAFTVAPALTTRYRVEAKTSPRSTSPVVEVAVRPRIRFRVSDSTVRRGRRVRFAGTVAPAHDGATAALQRRTRTRGFRTIARLPLRPAAKPERSRFAKRLRVRRTGVYRVTLAADADHAKGVSRKRRVRVR